MTLNNMEYLIDIPGRLNSVAVEKHIAGTDQIYDDLLETTLDILNLENITDVKVQDGKLLFLNIQGLVLKEISIASQKQSDWNLTDSTQVDFIKGKPTVYNKLEVDDKLITKQDTINDLTTIRSGSQAGATAYQKPSTGIPATDLASAVQVSLGKADTALQEHQSLARLVNTGSYNTVSKKIELNHDNTVLAEIDATAFIKDGMVSSVTISNGYLVITFNTDAGKEPISIALTDIFNPANYYDKNDVDGLLAGKADSADLASVATSGSYNDLSDKPDLSAFITKSVNDLTNYYLKSETYTKTEVQQLIGAIQQFHYEVYPTLPQTGASNVLYLIGPTGTGADKYEEYVYANNDWTKIGDTSIDLSGYVTTEALTTALADYVTSSALSTILSSYVNKDEIDDVPTANSKNPVTSGGVYSSTPSITNTDAESDLDFSDEDGNVLLRLSGGHIKTKNFDSSNRNSVNIIDTSSKVIYTVANTLTNGQTMTLNKPNLKNHYTLSFSATVNTMGTITIISGSENNWSKGRVEITPTNIVYYKYGTWEAITIPHNISIQDNISVIIKTTKVHFAEIYLLANNSQTEIFHQEISWNGCGNGCTLSSANGSYNNCTFSLNCQGLLKDVWVFGDSYTDAWPLSLDELGFDNYLLDGFSGRTSQEAYQSFLKDIELAKPKAIIWMMGMNDPDSGSVNASWKTAFDNVKTLCDTYKIEFIYATIPCVPQRNHSYKNDYAINSGVRIIPIASILGASSQGSSWYAGLLSSDDVHPSISGRLWIALTLLNNITLLQEK